jgi:gas vesicle protein
MKIKRAIRKAATWLAVAGIGAAAALLFAPQSGRRTRRQIKRAAERGWGLLNDEFEKAQDLYARGRSVAGTRVQQFRRLTKKIA